MKFEPHLPHLPQLPSLGELLEHPRVKGVVTRINRSTIAQRATGFLEELRASLAERAGKWDVPPVGQLAERLARRLLGEPISAGPIINATGVVVGDPQLVPPLADAAIHAMAQVGGEYHGADSRLAEACTDLLCELTAAEGALIVSGFEAALALTLSATAGHREALVCGEPGAVGRIDWQRLGLNAGAVIQHGGVKADEIMAKISDRPPAAIVRVAAPNAADLQSLVANKGQSILIDAAPLAGFLNPSAYGLESLDPLNDRLAAGADLVIADGAGLLGGPSCGVVVGKRALIEAAAHHSLATLLGPSAASLAALYATLSAYRNDKDSIAFTIPVWQLLSAPPANGKQRAERLAPLIAALPSVASAEAREVKSPWRAGGNAQTPSWGIDIHAKNLDASTLAQRLQQQSNAVMATIADGAVRLDLRSVFPRWDQQLVAAVEQALASG